MYTINNHTEEQLKEIDKQPTYTAKSLAEWTLD